MNKVFTYSLVLTEGNQQFVTGLCVKAASVTEANMAVMIAVTNSNHVNRRLFAECDRRGYGLGEARLVSIKGE